MSSKKPSDAPDPIDAIRLTGEDLAALRKSQERARTVSPEEYRRLLAQFSSTPAQLRARKGPRGPERFRL
jgi:hypothetical protein